MTPESNLASPGDHQPSPADIFRKAAEAANLPGISISFTDPPLSAVETTVGQSVMFAPHLRLPGRISDMRREFAAWYGYTILLSESIYSTVILALEYYRTRQMEQTGELGESYWKGLGNLKFEDAIHQFSRLLADSERRSNGLIDRLHKARKLRNKLVHQAFDPSRILYFTSEGGVAKRIDELRAATDSMFALEGLLQGIANAYAADCGMTMEVASFVSSLTLDRRESFLSIYLKTPPHQRPEAFAFVQKLLKEQAQEEVVSIDLSILDEEDAT